MSQFLTDYSNADPDADFNGDGQLNYADVSAFSSAYGPLDGTSLEHWHYGYDYRNQLVEISHRQGTTTLAETFNTYDALARRVEESIDLNADSTPDAAKQLVYGGVSSWEVLEQIDLLNDGTSFTHVFGIGIDDEVSYRIEDLETPEDYWSHRDDQGSLTSITNDSGVVKERYEYGDYGEATILDASGTVLPASSYGAYHLYTGRSMIAGTGLYDCRFRVLEPGTGRFGQRDPLGYIDSMNLYGYAMTNPTGYTDPYGLSPGIIVIRYDDTFDSDARTTNKFNRQKIQKKLQDIIDKCGCDIKVVLMPHDSSSGPPSDDDLGLTEEKPKSYTHYVKPNFDDNGKNILANTPNGNGGHTTIFVVPLQQAANDAAGGSADSDEMSQAYANTLAHEALWLGLLSETDPIQKNRFQGYVEGGRGNGVNPIKVSPSFCKKLCDKLNKKFKPSSNSCDAEP